ncbi:leucyl aminopeptidase [Nanoarchaeota archaeon]
MKFEVIKQDLNSKTDALIIGVFEGKALPTEAKQLDKTLNGAITKTYNEFKGEKKQVKVLTTMGKHNASKIYLLGLGKQDGFTLDSLRKAAAVAVKKARDDNCKHVSLTLTQVTVKGEKEMAKAQAVAEGIIMGLYDFNTFKTEREKIKTVNKVTIIAEDPRRAETGVLKGNILGESVNYTRDLVNLPANEVTPKYLAKQAEQLGKEHGFKVTIMGKDEMKKLGLNCILAVTKGSNEEPKLIVMEKKAKGKKMALVGKGITFDSGGLNIKTGKWMYDMKLDMGGAAAVLGTMKAVCELGMKVNLVGVIPTCENLTGGSAQKPGDIIKAYNGKTIEVGNTDAEGRLLLADAIPFTFDKYKPDSLIDLATLTGAIVMALGYQAAGLFGNDTNLKNKIKKAAETTQERVWELPMYEEYSDWVKSDFADVKNIQKAPQGYEAGSCTAAAFLESFVDGKWAHIDIAGTAFVYENSEYLHKGGTGYGVRLLTQLLSEWK